MESQCLAYANSGLVPEMHAIAWDVLTSILNNLEQRLPGTTLLHRSKTSYNMYLQCVIDWNFNCVLSCTDDSLNQEPPTPREFVRVSSVCKRCTICRAVALQHKNHGLHFIFDQLSRHFDHIFGFREGEPWWTSQFGCLESFIILRKPIFRF